MDDFTFYANKNGVLWYRCNYCNNLTRGKPDVCPVCNGHGNLADHMEKSSINENAAFERSIQKLKDVITKYQKQG